MFHKVDIQIMKSWSPQINYFLSPFIELVAYIKMVYKSENLNMPSLKMN